MDEYQPSKTEKKKTMHALQALALRLTTLSRDTLKNMDLPVKLFDALCEYQGITSNGAKRRQAQYLGRLMRDSEEVDEIRAYIENIEAQSAKEKAHFHQIEKWRERLIHEGRVALTEFVKVCPTVDVQQLRHLLQKAKLEQASDKSQGAYKALFRFIREEL